ncbi:hydantoinase/oxoprolinase family protein [Leptolyngbya sp. 15MV]|nr:hydantoinase/oxoprolinase family protein [Leptolyngbya sp. 15MV]
MADIGLALRGVEGGRQHVRLHLLPAAVHGIQRLRDGTCLDGVVLDQQAQAEIGFVDAPRGVDARASRRAITFSPCATSARLSPVSGITSQTVASAPSTPHDSSEGILAGVHAVTGAAGVDPAGIEFFLHGTTVATNAVLEGKGARVGLIVTEGYRDVMQIARSFVPGGLAAWIIWPKPQPLAALEDTVTVKGRMDADGREVRPLDEAEVRAKLGELRDAGVEAITVSLINAYTNGEHEARIGAIARDMMQDVPVSLSHEVLPEMQEYERTLSTVANASVRPVVGKYVSNLRDKLHDAGVTGKLSLLRSDGGLMSSHKAEEHPVNILMSGPAGGVTGALWVARNAGLKNILTLDVGGTSTDVALIENLEPRRVRTTEVGHLSVRASSLDVKTVGAGGGSIAYVPELTGALRVGPQSAGAVPGPVAYGKGGEAPTVTDANVVLGYLPEDLPAAAACRKFSQKKPCVGERCRSERNTTWAMLTPPRRPIGRAGNPCSRAAGGSSGSPGASRSIRAPDTG